MSSASELRLFGGRALVTGAGRGIGWAISERFYELGASVVLNDVDVDRLEDAKSRLIEAHGSGEGQRIELVTADIGSPTGVEDVLRHAERTLGGIDILVNNAGVTDPWLATDMPLEAWERTMRVNLTAPFLLAQAVIRSRRAAGSGGRIINISSIAGKRISVHAGSAYTASKAGLLGLTRHLAYECAPYGITVNAICPGGVLTEGLDDLAGSRGREKRLEQIPLGRYLAPREIADAVALLASESSGGITGVALDVDGGSLLGWESTSEYERWMGERQAGPRTPTVVGGNAR